MLFRSYTYYWNRYNVVSTTTYKWDKYNRVSTTTYTWNKYSIANVGKVIREAGYGVRGQDGSGGTNLGYSWKVYIFSNTEVPTVKKLYGEPIMVHSMDYTVYNNTYFSSYPVNLPSTARVYDTTTYNVSNSEGEARNYYEKVSILGEYYTNGQVYYYFSYNVRGYAKYEDGAGELQGTVSSTSSTAYPNGGASGSYWYDGRTSSTEYSKGSTYYGQVSSTNSSAYPSNGQSGAYWYVSAGSDTSYSKGSTLYSSVSSTSSSAYPNPGHQDGYWYENRQEVITYSMGSYIEDVFSTNPQRYPTNGIDGAYWYVLQS